MTRKLLSSLEGQRIGKILPDMNHYVFYDPKGRKLFTVLFDDLFDGDGDRFDDDVPSATKRSKSHPYRVQYRYSRRMGYWRFKTETAGNKKHMRFASYDEAKAYCAERMNSINRLPEEEWQVVEPKP